MKIQQTGSRPVDLRKSRHSGAGAGEPATASEERNGPTDMETLLGGSEMTATMKDGTKVQVFVRQLPVQDYPALLSSLGDESKMLDIYCHLPDPANSGEVRQWRAPETGWSKGLTIQSHTTLIEEAERLNADFFGRWGRRQINLADLMTPGISQKMFKAVTATVETLRSQTLPDSSQK